MIFVSWSQIQSRGSDTINTYLFVVSVQLLSHVRLFVTYRLQHTGLPLSCTISQSLLKSMPIESGMPSNHLILCCPLLLPSTFASSRVFSSESALCITWPNYWSFSFSISPSSGYSGLISFRLDWLDQLKTPGHKQAWSLRWRCAVDADVQ